MIFMNKAKYVLRHLKLDEDESVYVQTNKIIRQEMKQKWDLLKKEEKDKFQQQNGSLQQFKIDKSFGQDFIELSYENWEKIFEEVKQQKREQIQLIEKMFEDLKEDFDYHDFYRALPISKIRFLDLMSKVTQDQYREFQTEQEREDEELYAFIYPVFKRRKKLIENDKITDQVKNPEHMNNPNIHIPPDPPQIQQKEVKLKKVHIEWSEKEKNDQIEHFILKGLVELELKGTENLYIKDLPKLREDPPNKIKKKYSLSENNEDSADQRLLMAILNYDYQIPIEFVRDSIKYICMRKKYDHSEPFREERMYFTLNQDNADCQLHSIFIGIHGEIPIVHRFYGLVNLNMEMLDEQFTYIFQQCGEARI